MRFAPPSLLFLNTFPVPHRQTKSNCIALLLLSAFPWRKLTTGIATRNARGFDKDDHTSLTLYRYISNFAPQLYARHGTWHLAFGNRFPTPLARQLVWEAKLMSQREKAISLPGSPSSPSPSHRQEAAQSAWYCGAAWALREPPGHPSSPIRKDVQQTANLNRCVHYVHFLHFVPAAKEKKNPGIPKARSQRLSWHRELPAAGASRRRC